MLEQVKKYLPHAMAVFMAVIFLDSLRFKFTNHPNTQEIFSRLDGWSASLGAGGLFGQTGLFSQYVIGTAELVAATLLLVGILPRFRHWQGLGAVLGTAVMLGAVSFHLFTPLGTDPNNDGGGLFIAACINLVFGLVLIFLFRRRDLLHTLSGLGRVLGPRRLND